MSVHDDTHWPKVVVCGNKSTHGARVSKRFTLTDTGLHILLLNSQKQLFDENVRRLTENLKAIAEKHTWFPFVFYGFAKYVSEPEDLEILQQVLSKFFEDHRSYFMFGHPNRDVSAFALFSRAVVDIVRYKKIFKVGQPSPSIFDLWFIEWLCEQDTVLGGRFLRILSKYDAKSDNSIQMFEPTIVAMKQLLKYHFERVQRIREKLELADQSLAVGEKGS